MSTYKVVGAVDETLRSLLWSAMQSDSGVTSIIGTEQQISFEPLFKLVKEADPDEHVLSVFLYRIVEDAEMKNRPLQKRDTNEFRYPPLSLDLYYLVTPLTNSSANDHLLLGKAMQVLYDNSVVKGSALGGVLLGTAEELRVTLNPVTLEDITKLWSALMRPYRLSVSYQVKVVYIDSEREEDAGIVQQKRLEFTQHGRA